MNKNMPINKQGQTGKKINKNKNTRDPTKIF